MKWLWNKFWMEHTPQCNCGWNMKPYKESMFHYEWKCIWHSCGWGAFQSSNGKMHWWQEKN